MNVNNVPIIILSWKHLDKLILTVNSLVNMSHISLYICDNLSVNSNSIKEYIVSLFENGTIKGYVFLDENIYFNAWPLSVKFFNLTDSIIGFFENDRIFYSGVNADTIFNAASYMYNNKDIFSVSFSNYKSGIINYGHEYNGLTFFENRSVGGSTIYNMNRLGEYYSLFNLPVVDCFIERYILDNCLSVLSVPCTHHHNEIYGSTKWSEYNLNSIITCSFSGKFRGQYEQ